MPHHNMVETIENIRDISMIPEDYTEHYLLFKNTHRIILNKSFLKMLNYVPFGKK